VSKPDWPPAAIQAVDRACQRSAAVVHVEMNQGLNILASNACIAPWIGLFGTLVGMVNSFPGCSGEMSGCATATAGALSISIWPTALGLFIGLISLWFYRYLSGELESIDSEMSNASLGLLNELTRYRGHFQTSAIDRLIELPSFGASSRADSALQAWWEQFFDKYVADVGQDLRSWLRSSVLAFAAFVFIWCTRVAEYFFYESTSFHSAATSADFYVLITFGISCFYGIAHRRSGGALVLGSVLCLCLNLIELAFRMRLF
jgi:hypothetical protein